MLEMCVRRMCTQRICSENVLGGCVRRVLGVGLGKRC